MRRLRIIIDTNVMVSGLRSQLGASFRLLSLLKKDAFVFSLSVPLVVEYEKALRDPRVGIALSEQDIGRFIDSLCTLGAKRMIHFLWRPCLRDPKDDMVLEVGVRETNSDRTANIGLVASFSPRRASQPQPLRSNAETRPVLTPTTGKV